MAKSKAIIVSSFNILAPSLVGSRLTPDELREAMGSTPLTLSDLDKIKVPLGGYTTWQMLDKNGKEIEVKSFEALIVACQDVRLFYATKYDGEHNPPDCMSIDLIHGVMGDNCPEDVTGECASCPKSAFGSATNEAGEPGKGQACGHRKQMLLYREHDLLPVFLSIPPTSLKEVAAYLRRLTGGGEGYYSVITKFSLRKAKTGGGMTYSQVECEIARPLNDEEYEKSKALRAQFLPAVQRTVSE